MQYLVIVTYFITYTNIHKLMVFKDDMSFRKHFKVKWPDTSIGVIFAGSFWVNCKVSIIDNKFKLIESNVEII